MPLTLPEIGASTKMWFSIWIDSARAFAIDDSAPCTTFMPATGTDLFYRSLVGADGGTLLINTCVRYRTDQNNAVPYY